MNKKEAREIIEDALTTWPSSKMDKTLFIIEILERVKDGEFQ